MTVGATRMVCTPENVESISRSPQYELICSEAFLPNDYRGHSSELDLGNRSVRSILHLDQQCHPYKLAVVLQLKPEITPSD
ncbi:hypothetical protein AVEN_21210-1 [Araneus ventricosus]|uniref:Uncharacterized protein n=1 Tax=Araneus ventricosus TaxID=182803 RepID=A0A4Y2T707_ARAVE|nr:hypothetical protein AVEN_21210-1 [Araneus ventricosus]